MTQEPERLITAFALPSQDSATDWLVLKSKTDKWLNVFLNLIPLVISPHFLEEKPNAKFIRAF